jgi:protein TonB
VLIRPLATKASTAGIFIREGGAIHGEASHLEFPFRSSLLTPGPPRVEPAESKPAAPSPAAAPPAPAGARNVVRGQIVPIASRRDAGPVSPAPSVEPVVPAKPLVEAAAPAAASVTARVATPVVSDPPKPAQQAPVTKVDDKAAKPKVDEKVTKPAVEDKSAAKPKVEERAAKPAVEDKSAAKPKVDDKAAKPPVEDKAVAKPKVDDKGAKPKVDDKAVAKPKVEEKASPAKVAAAPAPVAAAAVTAPVEEPAQGRGKFFWIGVGGAILVALLVVFLVYPPLLHRNRPSGAAVQDTSQLSLRVERTAGEIVLTWNRDSDAIRSATHAVLSIADGDQHENVEMDLAQLRIGSISYSPASSDVVFKMEVTGRNQEKTASESLRVLRTRPSPVASPDPAQQPGPGQPPAKGAVVPGSAPQANAASANPIANAGNTAGAPGTPGATATPAATNPEPPAPEETPKAPERALKPFQAPSPLSQRLHPANPADLPDAPSLGGVTSSSAPAVTGFNMNSVTTPLAPPKPGSPTPSAPAEKKATTGGQIQQAVLVTRKEPEYPKLARETGAKGIVELVATIGTDGRVKSVKVVKGPPMLIKAASDAVLQWKYKPTILNGTPVEAQTQVFVNFMGGDR